MKKLFLFFIILLIAGTISAQKWETNFETAKKLASDKGRNIVLVFSGSDWCAPCIKLDNQIWRSPEFINYSKDNFILLRADFPKKRANTLSKEQQNINNNLAEIYNKQGLFPFVAVLNKNGVVLGNTGYKNVSPTEYIAILNSF